MSIIHNCLNLELRALCRLLIGGCGLLWVDTSMQLSIQHTVICLDFPPHNYTLMVEDPERNMADPIVQASLATGSVIRIVVNDLMEDTRYLYYVVATNQFGSRSLSSVGICKATVNVCTCTIIIISFTFSHF